MLNCFAELLQVLKIVYFRPGSYVLNYSMY